MRVNVGIPDLRTLRAEVAAGRLSRHGLLEEVERHLERASEEPVEGVLEFILEELHHTPRDPHLLRLLARLHARNGPPEEARRALELAARERQAAEGPPGVSLDDRLLIARVLLESGQPAQAEQLAREVLTTEPNNLSALNLLAKICHIQGRLSETIALWARLHLLAPNREGALAQLGLLHRLAHDSEHALRQWIPLGEGSYARKHQAQLDFEAIISRFRRHDFQGALAGCEQLAATYKGQSPSLYKLAVLQKAWIQERTHELEGARATLGRLGRERGFETDLDRLSFLARVCERIGTRESLGQALHIYEYLNLHRGKLSVLPRLAALSQARGNHRQAAAYTREYERRFARRMQRPLPSEVVRALSLHYIPLSHLPPLSLAPEERAAVEREIRHVPGLAFRQRCRALLAWLLGELPRARQLFHRLTRSRHAAPRDFAYLADCCEASGDQALAHTLYVEALQRGASGDAALWRKALAGVQAGEDSPLSALLQVQAVREEALHALLQAARSNPSEPQAWRTLASLERHAGLEEAAAAHETKAQALERALSRSSQAGRVMMAAVYSLNGKPKGLIHELLATRRAVAPGSGGVLSPESGVLGNVTPDLRALATSCLAMAKDFAQAHWPHLCEDADDYVYTLKVAKDDEPSSGASAGLPMTVAFLSLLLRKEVPATLALTGAVVCDSRREVAVRRIGDGVYKLKGAYHCNLSGLLLPEENREEIESAVELPRAISQSLARYVRNLTHTVEVLWGPQAWEW